MKQKPILKGLDYFFKLANPATPEDYLALVARIKPLVDSINQFHEGDIYRALNGNHAARVSLGMEKA